MRLRWAWEQRRRRATELAARHPEAAAVLTFYQEVAGFQQILATRPEAPAGVVEARRHRRTVALDGAARRLEGLLDVVSRAAPAPMAEVAWLLRTGPAEVREALLAQYLTGETPGGDEEVRRWLLARSFLQPYAAREVDGRGGTPGATAGAEAGDLHPARVCPRCGSAPLVGVLSDTGREEGAFHLICSLCGEPWRYPRLVCTLCGEERAGARTYFQADAFPHLRLDCCGTCGGYLKVTDLRRQALAVPDADDLASLTLDLWAQGQGYTKVEPNLAGL
ncbi:formate dehydrogenase accessory protein FdhE domain-containing protein [Limnochorda pilosa]|uniref:Formate dehydrogenase accessory protein FdhE n=1 Tax=Limnochorda pilosa TaxID=1555112 RepID=A0A0K2SKM6_LIMPI|nr:formate dehydrogenase accessory protein FdhE [Limnochorda pilosa]BAS27653.1 formate dehydrogenase accessory protein FdhE [Limnochorda pilosa]